MNIPMESASATDHIARLENLLSTTFYLMSKHARDPSPQLAAMVVDHLSLVSRHIPRIMPALGNTAARLIKEWLQIWQKSCAQVRPGTHETLQ